MMDDNLKIQKLVEPLSHENKRIVVIGSSTGGPPVLEKIITGLDSNVVVPVVIAQHMPDLFIGTYISRLRRLSKIEIKELKHEWEVKSGVVYFCPGDQNVRFKKKNILGKEKIAFDCFKNDNSDFDKVYPSVDQLFLSAAEYYGKGVLGIVLTGMGMDGKSGSCAIKYAGGKMIIQDKKSAVVYGMSGEVEKLGCMDMVLTPDEIPNIINKIGKL